MNFILRIVIEYLVVFILVFICNYFLFIKKKVSFNKNKVPMELNYLIALYDIDIKKINYKRFVYLYSLINTFIISTIYIIVVYLLNNIWLQIIIGIILLALLIIICYGLLGRHYGKKSR